MDAPYDEEFFLLSLAAFAAHSFICRVNAFFQSILTMCQKYLNNFAEIDTGYVVTRKGFKKRVDKVEYIIRARSRNKVAEICRLDIILSV